jgi:hypothetical protein
MEIQEQSIKKAKNQNKAEEMEPVLRIRDTLVRIWICGSIPLTNGSGLGSGSDRLRILLFSLTNFKMETKNYYFSFFCLYFSSYIYIMFKEKSHKKSLNNGNQGFSYYFCLMTEGSKAGSGSVHRMYPDP